MNTKVRNAILIVIIILVAGAIGYSIGKGDFSGQGASVYGITTNSITKTPTTSQPVGLVTLAWNAGQCWVLTWSNGAWNVTGSVNVSKINCHDLIAQQPTRGFTDAEPAGTPPAPNYIPTGTSASSVIHLEWSNSFGCLVWRFSKGSWTLVGVSDLTQSQCNDAIQNSNTTTGLTYATPAGGISPSTGAPAITKVTPVIHLDWSTTTGCTLWKGSQGNWTFIGSSSLSQAQCHDAG